MIKKFSAKWLERTLGAKNEWEYLNVVSETLNEVTVMYQYRGEIIEYTECTFIDSCKLQFVSEQYIIVCNRMNEGTDYPEWTVEYIKY